MHHCREAVNPVRLRGREREREKEREG